MKADGEHGSIVTLLCDGGDRYANTYYSDEWLAAQGLEPAPYLHCIEGVLQTGVWPDDD
jgi:cysteine synthase A